MSVTIRLEDELDVARGDMICIAEATHPWSASESGRTVCWMSERPLRPGDRLCIKHTTRSAQAIVVDAGLLHQHQHARTGRVRSRRSALNDIGRVGLRTTAPLMFDEYRTNRATGSFILVDEQTNITVAAGMILPEGA